MIITAPILCYTYTQFEAAVLVKIWYVKLLSFHYIVTRVVKITFAYMFINKLVQEAVSLEWFMNFLSREVLEGSSEVKV